MSSTIDRRNFFGKAALTVAATQLTMLGRGMGDAMAAAAVRGRWRRRTYIVRDR